jgi:predicted DsbA family dithiol-disulfide isomerase
MPFGAAHIRVEVVIDTVCPWCYIGKKRLKRAFALRPHLTPRVHWTPFMLNPDMPRGGMDRKDYLARKFGGADRAERMYATIEKTGRVEGIEFSFDRIGVTPNSLNSHRLIRYAARFGDPDKIVELILDAYFVQALDIGDHTILANLARQAGLSFAQVSEFLAGTDESDAVHAEYARVRRLGVTGVPAFLMGDGNLIAGAQEPAVLARIIDVIPTQAAEEYATKSDVP